MPFLIALAGIIVTAYIWANRASNARNVVSDVADMANDVRLAARRFGFRRQAQVHPVESIEDPRLAMAAIATSFIELDDLPTAEQRQLLIVQLRSELRADAQEAEEMEVLGRWFMNECGGAEPAIARLSRKLFKLDGSNPHKSMNKILTACVGKEEFTRRQQEAMDDIARALRQR